MRAGPPSWYGLNFPPPPPPPGPPAAVGTPTLPPCCGAAPSTRPSARSAACSPAAPRRWAMRPRRLETRRRPRVKVLIRLPRVRPTSPQLSGSSCARTAPTMPQKSRGGSSGKVSAVTPPSTSCDGSPSSPTPAADGDVVQETAQLVLHFLPRAIASGDRWRRALLSRHLNPLGRHLSLNQCLHFLRRWCGPPCADGLIIAQ